MKNYGITSRYYLYVQFKPGYGSSFTFNSDDSRGSERGLENLLRRVFRKAIVGRYDFAKLVDRQSNEVLGYFLSTGEMYTAESWAERLKHQQTKAPFLKASMAFYPEVVSVREKYSLPPLLTLYASTRNAYGSGLGCALMDLRRQASAINSKLPFKMVYIWRHPGNQPVGKLRPDGLIEILDPEFYRQVLAEKPLPEIALNLLLKHK